LIELRIFMKIKLGSNEDDRGFFYRMLRYRIVGTVHSWLALSSAALTGSVAGNGRHASIAAGAPQVRSPSRQRVFPMSDTSVPSKMRIEKHFASWGIGREDKKEQGGDEASSVMV
jgi:hypothetical protein